MCIFNVLSLEFAKLFTSTSTSTLLLNLQHIESDSLAQRSALTDSDNVSLLNSNKTRGAVGSQVGVSLFITVVLFDKVQVLSSNDNSSFHLGRLNDTRENATTDADVSGERALFVNISSFDSFLGCLESKANFLVPAFANSTLQSYSLVVLENGVLLLIGSFGLDLREPVTCSIENFFSLEEQGCPVRK